MGVPAAAAGPVTSTSGATRIIVLTGCVTRDELLEDECAPDTNCAWYICVCLSGYMPQCSVPCLSFEFNSTYSSCQSSTDFELAAEAPAGLVLMCPICLLYAVMPWCSAAAHCG